MRQPASVPSGFSLIELSMVLIIVTLLFSSMIPGFSAWRQGAENEEVQRQLATANEALLGFAMRNGRLPCPAAPATSGSESPETGGNCSHPWNGLLPASSLGLQPLDEHGYALDPWGNPLHYAISTFTGAPCGSAPCLSSENGIRLLWNSETPPAPDLRICSTAKEKTGTGDKAECAAGSALTKDAVAIVFSLGRNGKRNPGSADEAANSDNDRLFVSRPGTLPPDEFDDQISWLSSSIFYSRLMMAGRLP
jgi:prepilin-type N-terminal cleavage/methylation domain-containing protein